MSMSRAEQLADRFQQRCDAFAEYLATLSPEQWGAHCGNHPTIRVGDEEEGRRVGTVAHHVAVALPRQVGFLRAIISGGEIPRPSNAFNAEHARANPDPDRTETISLLRLNSAEAAGLVRALSDEELARTGQTFAGEVSASNAIERVLIGHVDWHEESIRATLGT
jgi:hypothetical protein